MRLGNQPVQVNQSQSRYAYFDFGPHKSDNRVQLALAGYERTLSDYIVDRKEFPCWGVEFVVGGRGHLELDKQSYELRTGSAFSYGPHTPHRIESDSKQPLEKYFIDLYGTPAELLLEKSGWRHPTHRPNIQTLRIGTLIGSILHDEANNQSRPEIIQTTLLLILLLSHESAGAEVATAGSSAETYQRVRRFFEQHYFEPGNIVDLAKRLHLDSTYLTRLFKSFSNETPYLYLNRLRMTRASQLILHHNLQIQEVAQAVGFRDAFHFSTRFKSFHGLSPRQFRERYTSD